jgi:putative membrane protein
MMGGFGFGGLGVVGWILNLIIMVGLIVGMVLLAIWGVRTLGSGSLRPGAGSSAREILQARYARGEVTREQYQQILADLA